MTNDDDMMIRKAARDIWASRVELRGDMRFADVEIETLRAALKAADEKLAAIEAEDQPIGEPTCSTQYQDRP